MRSRCFRNVPICCYPLSVFSRCPGLSRSWRWAAVGKAAAGEAVAPVAELGPAVGVAAGEEAGPAVAVEWAASVAAARRAAAVRWRRPGLRSGRFR